MRNHAGALAGNAGNAALWAGKSATLDWLSTRVAASRVPPGVRIEWTEWRSRRSRTLEQIRDALDAPLLIVRSDRADEDDPADSQAGRYLSRLDLDTDDAVALAAAIDAVFASYGHAGAGDGVLIQRQVAPVRAAVVASTHGLPDGVPYYAISLSHGARSDSVTRGDGDVETWYVARERTDADLPEPVRACLDALIELESLAAATPCEAEIVLAETGLPWVVQLRRLPVRIGDERAVAALRRRTEDAIASDRDVPLLGMMPDWNPAELLGEHPRPLALDIFDRVIARRAWRRGRAMLGYSRRGPAGLLRVHAGRPYVDVAASFRSLLPATVDEALGERLVAAWITRLEREPALHDKIEFDVAMSAVVFGFDATFDARHGKAFTTHERDALREALRPVTQRALDAALTERLDAHFAAAAPAPPVANPADILRHLAAIERGVGAAFAASARQAFVADALLRSAVEAGALAPSRLNAIRRAVETIASEFHAAWSDDDRSALMRRFGRQRAGTFELCAPTLSDVAADLAEARTDAAQAHAATFVLHPSEKADMAAALRDCGLALTPDALVAQYARAVRARELGKFALADRVSAVLEAIAGLAQQRGIGRDDAGWLPLDALLAPDADGIALRERAHEARARHALESQLRMPLLIGRGGSLDVVAFLPGRPNYVGHGRAQGRPVVADAHSRPAHVPPHAMLAIASADPGFEWMFLRRPAAIVTAYGGPNSHIAIRCVELGIPALLGVGPEAFRRIATAARLMIDFDTGTWSIA